jgi:hypothetical protein
MLIKLSLHPDESASLDFQQRMASVISASATKNRKGAVSAEELAKRWCIGLEMARNTL